MSNIPMKKWKNVLINNVASSSLVPVKIRHKIYSFCGIQNDGVCFPNIFIQTEKLKVGKGTWINNKCFIDNYAQVTIGTNVGVAMEVMFCTTTHELGDSEQRAGAVRTYPIVVGDGCWIGARATIMAGVTIGKGCVIASGSLVNKDCEPNGMYAGVPAKRIKELSPYEVIHKQMQA